LTGDFQMQIPQIRQQFLDEGFVKFNFGKLSEEDLFEIASHLGKPLPVSRHNYNGHRYIQDVSPNGLFKSDEVPWHNDFSYSQGHYDGTLLYMQHYEVDVPTEFADMCAVYEKLPKELKNQYEDIVCGFRAPEHYHDLLSTSQLKLVSQYQSKKKLVLMHPIVNATSIYFSPATLFETSSPIDMDYLLSLTEEVKFQIHYKEDDLVIFDNLRFMHRRPSFSDGFRQMLRISFCYV